MYYIKIVIAVLTGFSSGLAISGGVFAFISVIGLIPRITQKTGTQKYIHVYEDCIVLGGVFGASTSFFHYYIPVGKPLAVFLSTCIGIFIGCLAISLAEVLDVIPVFTRRARITQGVAVFILMIALGKLAGSLLYYGIPGFFK